VPFGSEKCLRRLFGVDLQKKSKKSRGYLVPQTTQMILFFTVFYLARLKNQKL
tara:strand:- start:85 stop:243 length:159 start_codon:yes stop_codon:yes gene_type:complete